MNASGSSSQGRRGRKPPAESGAEPEGCNLSIRQARTGIAPIIQELQPVLGRRGVSNVQTVTPRTVPGARIPGMNAELRGDAVLVDQAAEPVGSLDSVHVGEPPKGRVGDWDLKVDPAVRSLIVVMLDELPQYTVEMALTADEQPVEALGPGCPHEPFGERVRPGRPYGREDDPGADRPHHLVEGPDELGVPVTDEEPDGPALVLQGDCQVPGLLGDPGPDRVGRHAGQEDLATLEVDEEQHIEPAQRDRVDVEEVASERAGGLGSKEL